MTTPDQAIAASDAETLDRAAEVLARRYGLLTSGDVYAALRNRAEAIRAEAGLPAVPSLALIGRTQISGQVAEDAETEPGHGYWESGGM
jgi:hypothetical protein